MVAQSASYTVESHDLTSESYPGVDFVLKIKCIDHYHRSQIASLAARSHPRPLPPQRTATCGPTCGPICSNRPLPNPADAPHPHGRDYAAPTHRDSPPEPLALTPCSPRRYLHPNLHTALISMTLRTDLKSVCEEMGLQVHSFPTGS